MTVIFNWRWAIKFDSSRQRPTHKSQYQRYKRWGPFINTHSHALAWLFLAPPMPYSKCPVIQRRQYSPDCARARRRWHSPCSKWLWHEAPQHWKRNNNKKIRTNDNQKSNPFACSMWPTTVRSVRPRADIVPHESAGNVAMTVDSSALRQHVYNAKWTSSLCVRLWFGMRRRRQRRRHTNTH